MSIPQHLQGKWTRFSIDAEIDHFGEVRIIEAHNELYEELQQLKQRISDIDGMKEATINCGSLSPHAQIEAISIYLKFGEK